MVRILSEENNWFFFFFLRTCKSNSMEEKLPFQQMVWEQLNSHKQKKKKKNFDQGMISHFTQKLIQNGSQTEM